MNQRHLDRLTPIDAAFLHQEGLNSHMHVGGLTIAEGPPPDMDDFLEQIRWRLHLVPRYRHKLASTALDSGRPVWIDDPNFSLEFHVRHTALPTPGTWVQLQSLAARIFSQQLDRSKPLWEMWLIEGLKDDRFALITKTHHSLIDGIAGVDLATVLFDLSREPPPIRHSGRPWQPHREPGTVELIAAGVRGALRAGLALAEGAIEVITHPDQAFASVREAAEGIGEIIWAGLNPAPETPLNVPIGPHRRFVGVADRLDDFKLVKSTFGGTVNDVVLSVVAGARSRVSASRGRTQHDGKSHRRDARAPAGLHRRPAPAAALRVPGDGGAEGVKAGARGRGDRGRSELRAPHDARTGVAPELLNPPVQPAGHQRPRTAVPAVCARTGNTRGLPDRFPSRKPR